MALYYSLPIYRDTYSLILMLYRLTKEFQREYKYSIGQDIKRDVLLLVRHIYRANQAKSKEQYLAQFIDEFELLKIEIRLCFDLKLISNKEFADVIALMDSIGKQINGWRRSNVNPE